MLTHHHSCPVECGNGPQPELRKKGIVDRQWMTVGEYWASLQKRALLPRKAGIVLMIVVVVSAGLSFVLWMLGVGFTPVIRWIIFASGLTFGVAVFCLIAGFVLARGPGIARFVGSKQAPDETVHPIPPMTRSFVIVGFSFLSVVCVVALGWAIPGIIDVSGVGEALEHPGQELAWFGIYGLIDACMGCSVGAVLGGVGVMVWIVREAAGRGRDSLNAPDAKL